VEELPRNVASAVPPARNLFTQDPEHWSATLLTAFTVAAAPAHRDSAVHPTYKAPAT